MTTGSSPEWFEAFGGWIRRRGRDHLRPDDAAVDAIRASAVAAFRAEMASRSARLAAGPAGRAAPMSAETPRGRGATRGSRSLRRATRWMVAGALAAGLAVLTVGGPAWVFASESGPGHPFYDVRVAAETIGLPRLGTAARVLAEVDRLGRRVAEVEEEASSRDWPGARAALGTTLAQVRATDVALGAAPATRSSVSAPLRAARRSLRAVAADAAAPIDVRRAAHEVAALMGTIRATWRHPTAAGSPTTGTFWGSRQYLPRPLR